MRILLIDPPMQRFMGFQKYYIPLGLLWIAAVLRSRHEVQVYDADYNPTGSQLTFAEKRAHYSQYLSALTGDSPIWDEIREVVAGFRPDVVGISIISPKLASARRVAQIARDCGARVIAGGPHVSLRTEDVTALDGFDSVIVGEGEYAFEDALDAKKVVAKRITSLDDLPFPARDLLRNAESYRPRDMGMVMTSRGCPFSCSFCCSEALWGRRVAHRSIPNVVNEIASVAHCWGTKDFYIADDTFGHCRKRLFAFCQQMRGLGLKWSCLTRADVVDAELVAAMKAAGCSQVKVGLDSGSPRILSLMNKGEALDDTRRAAAVLNEAGMPWVAYGIVGFPSETPEEAAATLSVIEEIRPSFFSPSIFTPYPGTHFDSLAVAPYERFTHHGFASATGLDEAVIERTFAFADQYNKC